jgi:ketosteroid isomerase-like protein
MTTTANARPDTTTRPPSRAAFLAHAHASPAAVAAKDKNAWLALFADGGCVLDPVGTPACCKGARTFGRADGPDDLARFYDCFIAPNTIRFEVHRDLVADRSVVRDVTLHVTGPAGVPTAVPAHLVYTMADGPGAVRIARMEAFWQSADVMRTVRRAGLRGVAATMLNLGQLARSFGLAGARAYLRGVRDRVRSSVARDAVRAWVDAVDAADAERAAALCEPACEVELPRGERASIANALRGELSGWRVKVDKILVCGWAASCSLSLRSGDHERHGVAVFELARPSARFRGIRLYWDLD